MTLGIFEAPDTTGEVLVEIAKPFLQQFQLTNKMMANIMDEGANLVSLASTVSQVVSWDPIHLQFPYNGACFGHAMSKVSQHAMLDDKVCVDMSHVLLKVIANNLVENH